MISISDFAFSNIELVAFDFDGVFTSNQVIVSEDGFESVICSRSDGIGLSKLKDLDIPLIIISTEKNPVVLRRAEKLEVACLNGIEDKESALKNYCSKNNILLSNTVFMGNDTNDLSVMESVGFPIAVADCHIDLQQDNFIVTQKNGGYGAVREVCDKLSSDILNQL